MRKIQLNKPVHIYKMVFGCVCGHCAMCIHTQERLLFHNILKRKFQQTYWSEKLPEIVNAPYLHGSKPGTSHDASILKSTKLIMMVKLFNRYMHSFKSLVFNFHSFFNMYRENHWYDLKNKNNYVMLKCQNHSTNMTNAIFICSIYVLW